MITIKLLPKKPERTYPLDVDACARWLLSSSNGKRGQSRLDVIRRAADLAENDIVFSGKRKYSAGEILELFDEDGKLIGEDPRPVYT